MGTAAKPTRENRTITVDFHIPSDLVVDQGPVDAETSSPLDFLLLHDLWTTLRRS
jgi:hypothetical protein